MSTMSVLAADVLFFQKHYPVEDFGNKVFSSQMPHRRIVEVWKVETPLGGFYTMFLSTLSIY